MSATAKLDRNQAAEFLDGLRRDISAARLRVTLDEELGRDTPLPVKKLAALPEPPSIEADSHQPAEQAAEQPIETVVLTRFDQDFHGFFLMQKPGPSFDLPSEQGAHPGPRASGSTRRDPR